MPSLKPPFIFVIALVALVFQVSCDTLPEDPAPEEKPDRPYQNMKGDDSDFIGLRLRDAEALAKKRNMPFRVVSINGKPQMVTMDYSESRINFSTLAGKVIKTKRG